MNRVRYGYPKEVIKDGTMSYPMTFEQMANRITSLEKHVYEQDEAIKEMIRVHNGWASTVAEHQTRLVRLGKDFDLNGEINQLRWGLDALKEDMLAHTKADRERAKLLRRRVRTLEAVRDDANDYTNTVVDRELKRLYERLRTHRHPIEEDEAMSGYTRYPMWVNEEASRE